MALDSVTLFPIIALLLLELPEFVMLKKLTIECGCSYMDKKEPPMAKSGSQYKSLPEYDVGRLANWHILYLTGL